MLETSESFAPWSIPPAAGLHQRQGGHPHLAAEPPPEEQPPDRLRTALEMTADAVFFLSPPALRVFDVNRAACTTLGYSRNELLTMRLGEIAPKVGSVLSAAAVGQVIRKEVSHVRILAEHRHKSGFRFPVEIQIQGADCEQGETCLIAVARDLSERTRLQALSAQRVFRDGLTGLPDRTVLESRLRLAVDPTHSPGRRCAVLFVDLDRFKTVNDTLGHLAGDRVLQVVAQRLSDSVRPDDLVARFGGDEFVVLLHGVRHERQVTHIAQRISRALTAPVDWEGRSIAISASIGVAVASEGSTTAEQLVHEADRAMYRAKAR